MTPRSRFALAAVVWAALLPACAEWQAYLRPAAAAAPPPAPAPPCPEAAASPIVPADLPPITRLGRATLAVRPLPGASTAAFNIWLREGAGTEEPGSEGAAATFAEILRRRLLGPHGADAALLGANVVTWAHLDSIVIQVTLPCANLDRGVNLIAWALGAGKPDGVEFERARAHVPTRTRLPPESDASALENRAAAWELARILYGRAPVPSTAGLDALTLPALQAFAARAMGAPVIITATGCAAQPHAEALAKAFAAAPESPLHSRLKPKGPTVATWPAQAPEALHRRFALAWRFAEPGADWEAAAHLAAAALEAHIAAPLGPASEALDLYCPELDLEATLLRGDAEAVFAVLAQVRPGYGENCALHLHRVVLELGAAALPDAAFRAVRDTVRERLAANWSRPAPAAYTLARALWRSPEGGPLPVHAVENLTPATLRQIIWSMTEPERAALVLPPSGEEDDDFAAADVRQAVVQARAEIAGWRDGSQEWVGDALWVPGLAPGLDLVVWPLGRGTREAAAALVFGRPPAPASDPGDAYRFLAQVENAAWRRESERGLHRGRASPGYTSRAYAGTRTFGLYAATVPEALPQALGALAARLSQTDFAPALVRREQSNFWDDLAAEEANYAARAVWAFGRAAGLEAHAGRPEQRKALVRAYTSRYLENLAERLAQNAPAVLVIAGDVDPPSAAYWARKALAPLARYVPKPGAARAATAAPAGGRVEEPGTPTELHLVWGLVPRPDAPPMAPAVRAVAGQLFAGPHGVLVQAARGFGASPVAAHEVHMGGAGEVLAFHLGVGPVAGAAGGAMAGAIMEACRRQLQAGPDPTELADGKAAALAQHGRAMDDAGLLARHLAHWLLEGRSLPEWVGLPAAIQAVSGTEVREALARAAGPGGPITAVVSGAGVPLTR